MIDYGQDGGQNSTPKNNLTIIPYIPIWPKFKFYAYSKFKNLIIKIQNGSGQ